MDGTLVDSVDAVLRAYVRAVELSGGPRCTPADVRRAFAAGSTAAVLAALLGRPAGDGDLDRFYGVLVVLVQKTTIGVR